MAKEKEDELSVVQQSEGNMPIQEDEGKMPVKEARINRLERSGLRVVRFRGAVLSDISGAWKNITPDQFCDEAYKVLGKGLTHSMIVDIQKYYWTSAEDLTKFSHFIDMGENQVWNMKTHKMDSTQASEDCVYKTAVTPTYGDTHVKWLEEVASGDAGVANDILQALAPIFMYKKPFGLFWFVGNGANGKSTVLKSLYAIFGADSPFTRIQWFSQLDVGQIEDKRDAPTLNGKLGNICLESNEGHIKDGGSYKNLAEHSTFDVHEFQKQHMIEIDGNVHTIFNANNIPTFADKTNGVRRRTLLILFQAVFAQDNSFDDKLFAKDNFLSDLLGAILETTKKIAENNYNYEFSQKTKEAKMDYDEDVNTAEHFFKELIQEGILAWKAFGPVTTRYENWCQDRSYAALGSTHFRNAAKDAGFESQRKRFDGKKKETMYIHRDYNYEDLREYPGKLGLFEHRDNPGQLGLDIDPNEIAQDKLDLIEGL